MLKKILVVILASASVFASCKKTGTLNKTTSQKVLGKWSYVSNITVEYNAGVATPYSYPVSAADYIDFRNDGKVYDYSQGTYDTTTYSIVNDSLLKVDNYTLQIKTLTAKTFVIYSKEYFNGTDSSENTTTFKK